MTLSNNSKFTLAMFLMITLVSQSSHAWLATRTRKAKASVTLPAVNLTISASTTNYNIFTAASSPTSPVAVTLTVNSGVIVGSTSTATPAIDSGTFPTGSTLTIINNGKIIGRGGNGGAGGHGATDNTFSIGGNGTDGGPAMTIRLATTIQNNGQVWGGGGGGAGGYGGGYDDGNTTPGGGGTSVSTPRSPQFLAATILNLTTRLFWIENADAAFTFSGGGGGGGGGGCGSTAGTAGAAGTSDSTTASTKGHVGTVGSATGGGAGGAKGISNDTVTPLTDGADGGNGGDCGQPGEDDLTVGRTGTGYTGFAGAAGAAVNTNGYTLTWTVGGTAPNLKGATP